MNAPGTGQLQQRIRIGLTGLAFVFVLVLLGAAISRSGNDSSANLTVPNMEASEPNEPLAEIGAAPAQPSGNDADDPNSNR